uniref:Uncharacterized protein n=1 Tax=Salix viminalis TaxID=40686 RepID=A0A6N2LDD1_SALVM
MAVNPLRTGSVAAHLAILLTTKQETLPNLLLRGYLHDDFHGQAEKLSSTAMLPKIFSYYLKEEADVFKLLENYLAAMPEEAEIVNNRSNDPYISSFIAEFPCNFISLANVALNIEYSSEQELFDMRMA